MPYASQMDVENAYGASLVAKLSDTDNDGVANQETIDDALSSASSFIDAYIGKRYTVPVDPSTPVLRDLCVDIALYRMALSRLKQTDEMRLRYDDAIKLLERIGEGKAAIGQDTTGEGDSDDQGGSFSARTRWLQRA